MTSHPLHVFLSARAAAAGHTLAEAATVLAGEINEAAVHRGVKLAKPATGRAVLDWTFRQRFPKYPTAVVLSSISSISIDNLMRETSSAAA